MKRKQKDRLLLISTGVPSQMGGLKRLSLEMKMFSKDYEVFFMQIDLGGEQSNRINIDYKSIRIVPNEIVLEPDCLLLAPQTWIRTMKIASVREKVQDYIDKNKIDVVVMHPIDTCLALRGITAKTKIAEILDSTYRYYKTKHEWKPTLYTWFMCQTQCWLEEIFHLMMAKDYDLLVFVGKDDVPRYGYARTKSIVCEGRDMPMNNGG